ncbi:MULTISPECIES: YbaN family protein [Staphylococcus]|uniref:YbaN family protein n=1 Tax=Staphylococcus TaxID=1279 RepID=UPI000DF86786|nr:MULTISPECIES: YbaN family protein [unclassified Staphylococcus]UXV36259.1 YbaN family protein [Staphylococcus sp. IVB6181]
MRYILIAIGLIAAIVGFIGIVVPLLPTTPFLLLAAVCFSRSSERFNRWLVNTKIYGEYVESFKRDRGFTLKKKFKILMSLYIVIAFSIFMIEHSLVRIGLLIMVTIQTVVLFTLVKTLPEDSKEDKQR